MRPVPVVNMDEVLPHLTERGRIEWELAVTKAQLARALTTDEPVAESGHVPAETPAGKELTTPE